MSVPIDVEGPIRAEIFVVAMTPEGPVLTGPDGPRAWHVEVRSEHPLDTVRAIVASNVPGLVLVHSTSWRWQAGAVVLTFVAVVDGPGGMESVPVGRAEPARGTATAAPADVEQSQVLEHGLRHLAWLARDDMAVRGALDRRWHEHLGGYVPEPFRQI